VPLARRQEARELAFHHARPDAVLRRALAEGHRIAQHHDAKRVRRFRLDELAVAHAEAVQLHGGAGIDPASQGDAPRLDLRCGHVREEPVRVGRGRDEAQRRLAEGEGEEDRGEGEGEADQPFPRPGVALHGVILA
jgi:hypothetical protein